MRFLLNFGNRINLLNQENFKLYIHYLQILLAGDRKERKRFFLHMPNTNQTIQFFLIQLSTYLMLISIICQKKFKNLPDFYENQQYSPTSHSWKSRFLTFPPTCGNTFFFTKPNYLTIPSSFTSAIETPLSTSLICTPNEIYKRIFFFKENLLYIIKGLFFTHLPYQQSLTEIVKLHISNH